MVARRRFVTGGLAAAVSVVIAPATALAQTTYLTTIDMLQRSRGSTLDELQSNLAGHTKGATALVGLFAKPQ
jgi:hypothetical protein